MFIDDFADCDFDNCDYAGYTGSEFDNAVRSSKSSYNYMGNSLKGR